MSPKQRNAVIWFAPLLPIAVACAFAATDLAPEWFDFVVIFPSIIFMPFGELPFAGALILAGLTWYLVSATLIASTLRHREKRPLPRWERLAIAIFFVMVVVFFIALLPRLAFGG
jgi:hypothetical protein